MRGRSDSASVSEFFLAWKIVIAARWKWLPSQCWVPERPQIARGPLCL